MPNVRLVGARVFDTIARSFTEPSDVIFSTRSGLIICAGSGGPADVTLELDGAYLIPSFIDLHAHVTHDATAHVGTNFCYDESINLAVGRGIQNLTEALTVGIAVVRDVGGGDESLAQLRSLSRERQMLLPELATSGQPLCVPEGHAQQFGRCLDQNSDLLAELRGHRAKGHQWLKVMSGPERYDPVVLKGLTAAATAVGVKVAVHAFSDTSVWDAIEAGVHTIEHSLVTDERMAQAARSNGVAFIPTLYTAETSVGTFYASAADAAEMGHLHMWKKYLAERIDSHVESGLPMYPGSDGGCAPCRMSDLLSELECITAAGYPAAQVLTMATRGAAEILGVHQAFGSISPGMNASFLILSEDPSSQLSAIRHPLAIVHRGVPVIDAVGLAHA